jgi:hypothetical protein
MYRIYTQLVARLPSTYPRATLVVHVNLTELIRYYWDSEGEELEPGDPGHSPFGFCDGEDNTIHVSYTLIKESTSAIIWYFLHELGHLYALQQYGEKDPRFEDYTVAERYANRFANRWARRLKREGWLKKI